MHSDSQYRRSGANGFDAHVGTDGAGSRRRIGVILVIMSMISFGVAIERIYTFTQARKQSKLYAPQVAKHLKEGRLKDAIAISSSKNYRYSHLAKVVLAGLQEYQFQQESGGNLSREDLVDTVRRAIQRASALTANDLKKGVAVARDHRRDGAVRRTARHGRRHHHRVPGHRGHRLGRSRRGLGRYFGSARRDRARPRRRDSGGVVLQLPDRPHRVLQRRDGQLVVGAASTTSSRRRRNRIRVAGGSAIRCSLNRTEPSDTGTRRLRD